MQTRKRHAKKRHGKSKKNRINSKSMQKGGNSELIFSRTVYPYNATTGANPTDARQQMGGSLKKYSRKYYKKQSGGSGFSYTFSPADHADQPINGKYTETNRFLA